MTRQSNPGVSGTRPLPVSEDAVRQAIELPMQQVMQFQQASMDAFIGWFEVAHQLQGESITLAREATDAYLDTMTETVERTEEAAERGIQATQQGAYQATESMATMASGPVQGIPPQTGSATPQPPGQQAPGGQPQSQPSRQSPTGGVTPQGRTAFDEPTGSGQHQPR